MIQPIQILTSSGGYGHITATAAIEASLAAAGLPSKRVIALQEIAGACDMIATLSYGKWHAEGLYNALLRRRYYGMINTVVSFGLKYYAWRKPLLDRLCRAYVERERPPAIISVAPMINGSMARACAEFNIPFYIAPTDLDVSLFVSDITKEDCKTTTIVLPFKSSALEQQIPEYLQYVVNGPIVRKEFFSQESSHAAKVRLDLPSDRPTIVAMMGGQGAASSSEIVRALCTIQNPCTIVTINAPCGLAELPHVIPEHIILKEYGFRADMADFMRAADVLVTKGGSMSVLEALVSGTPLVLDGTRGMLRWEAFNYSFVERNGYGLGAYTSENIAQCVARVLRTPKELHHMRDSALQINGADTLVQMIVMHAQAKQAGAFLNQ